ncbi:MAG TPA: ATP-binding cassette domain-containing protein [Pyrinomonadaceae bacterium]|nr:ATP-binding cassette domain-containing protein [Pyrinomonadaceae bacterium]
MTSTAVELPAIEFRNVSFSFDGQSVIKDISFKLAQGEMILVIGESGSGKSVLLRLAIGLLQPDAGQIFVRGREIESLSEDELLGIRGGLMGMVFQEESLFTGLTVFENAAYRPRENGWAEDDVNRAVTEVLTYVGLQDEGEKFPEQLSGGMKRRLEIARALIGWPSIMFFDEPTMSLDPMVALQVLDLVIRARDVNHISCMYVTKKPAEIPYLSRFIASAKEDGRIVVAEADADKLPPVRIMMLEEGKLRFIGSASEFANCDAPSVKRMLTLDQHDHSADPYFSDPWDKTRHPTEKIL